MLQKFLDQRTLHRGILAAAAACLAVVAGQSAPVHASLIISDTFTTGTVGADINGRTPDTTDLPGTPWAQNGYYSGGVYQDEIVSSPSSSLELGAEAGDGIALTGVTATNLELSYNFNIASDSPNVGSDGAGSGLGFFRNATTTGSPGATTGFSGVMVSMLGGVSLLENGTSDATATISGFNVGSTHSLSYDVKTTTGDISNLVIDGSAVTLTGTTTGIFTGSNITEFGITNNAGGYGNSFDYVTNAQLSAPVPEPASIALVATGAAGMLLLRRRKYCAR